MDSSTSTLHSDTQLHSLDSSKTNLKALPAGLVLTPTNDDEFLILSFHPHEPYHPSNPLGFRKSLKIYQTTLAAMLVMNTALASSAPSGAAPYIQADLGGNATLVLSAYLFGYVVGPFIAASLSESFGRRPLFIYGTLLYTLFSGACIAAPTFNALIVLRFFAGVFGAVPTTNSGSTCGDLWTAEDRGVAMSYYSVATFAGPALGPVVGSFSSFAISAHPSWRYCFVILTAFSLLLFIPVLVLCPETYSPLLLTPLAADLRTSLSAPQIVSRMELEAILARRLPRGERWHAILDRLVIRPFEMLFTERIIFTTTIYMSFVYGLIYLLFEAYPIIFTSIHQLPMGFSSLPFLSTLVGAVLSVPVTLAFQWCYLRSVAKNDGVSTPEMRLPAAELGGIMVVISFLWLGWTGYRADINFIVPALSGVPQGIASILIFRALQTYLLDAYERFGASALAANVAVRSIAGGVFPLFARSLFDKLGVQWACTLLAGIMLLLVPIPFFFNRYGAIIRRRSRFAVGRD